MTEADHLIVGGGLAAASAADGIREEDPEGKILLLSDETEPPYHRPPLSKEYLQVPAANRGLLHVKPDGWYEERGVELALGARATRLDPERMEVETEDGRNFRGERILLATGGRPRRLPVPGADLDGVLTLRTVGDAERIQELAAEADRAVLVGAGFIGMELAASLSVLDVRATVVETEDRVWPRMLPPSLSTPIRAYLEERGVEFRLGSRVEEFRGSGRVAGARLEGGEELPCGLAVVGVGIRPNQELAAEAGLETDDGVAVDERGETSAPGIFATGDVARFPDPVFGGRSRVEHWDHAKVHGRLCGRNMAGADEAYDHLSYFFSDVFDLSLNVYGHPARAERVVARGSLEEGECVAFGVADGRVQAAVLVNAREAMEPCRAIVRARPEAAAWEKRLGDPDADLEALAEEVGEEVME